MRSDYLDVVNGQLGFYSEDPDTREWEFIPTNVADGDIPEEGVYAPVDLPYLYLTRDTPTSECWNPEVQEYDERLQVTETAHGFFTPVPVTSRRGRCSPPSYMTPDENGLIWGR
jgi:hypothetical protein